MSFIAALAACGILTGLAAFQAALAAGAPAGQFAWGGQHRVLPRGLRIGSVIAIAIYAAFAAIIVQRAGLIVWLPAPIVDIGIWVTLGYLVLGVGVNAISRSIPERRTMTPVAAVLSVLVLIVALGW